MLAICLAVFSAYGQTPLRCGFDEKLTSEDAHILAGIEAKIESLQGVVHPRMTVTLPVVFHVVYREEAENISDIQIRSQIDILNRDFAFMSDNFTRIPEEFKGVGGDADIRFCLASIDPDGNPTSGVTRTKTQRPYIGTHQESNGRYSVNYDIYGGKDGWDPERYINVWVADMDGLLGSGTLPGMAAHPEEDGIIIDPDFVGAIGTAGLSDPFDRGHTLTHEMGHYLGLYHIWGTGSVGCSSDDMVGDTPLQESFYLGCPEYPQYSCGSSDMFMNFMDFTNDRCLALFTRGQTLRMQATLMGLRSSLLENADACAPPDSGKIQINKALLFYAPSSRQIVITLDMASTELREVGLYSIDGRLVYSADWISGSVYWLNVDHLPAGIYVINLRSDRESVSRKLVVTNQ